MPFENIPPSYPLGATSTVPHAFELHMRRTFRQSTIEDVMDRLDAVEVKMDVLLSALLPPKSPFIIGAEALREFDNLRSRS